MKVKSIPGTILETKFGAFNLRYFSQNDQEGVCLSIGQIDKGAPLLRIQSSCLFSETLNAIDCDCKLQLDESMRLIANEKLGVIVYLYQEGRGVGLKKKIEAMELMRTLRCDTAEAFVRLGLELDPRNYNLSLEILKDLNVSNHVRLISNNPRKYQALAQAGYSIDERISLEYEVGPIVEKYLRSKEEKLGHTIEWKNLKAHSNRSYKAVIFDFDDTLVKTREVKWRQHQAVAKRFYGIKLTETKLREHWGKPYDDTLRAYYDDADTIENMRSAKLSMEAQFPVIAETDALSTVRALHERGVIVSVLSASRRELVVADLKRLGFDTDAFCLIQASDDTEIHKPDGRVFKPTLLRLAALGLTDSILYVGDSLKDYEAARNAGLDFVGVTTGLTTRTEFKSAGVTTIVERLGEIAGDPVRR